MRIALLQMCSSDDPEQNLAEVQNAMQQAARERAELFLIPEVANCVSMSRTHQAQTLQLAGDDLFLAGLRTKAAALGLSVLAGSLALKAEPPETRFVNRSYLIGSKGEISASYDKMHMFDVAVSAEETYRESSGYAPGSRAVLAQIGAAKIGLSICYDLRFAYLYRALAQAGAQILTIPAAFSPGTGPAHWQPLLQARAIETGCFVLAPAQSGHHATSRGKSRRTYGHSMVISPWGEILLDAGETCGLSVLDIDLQEVDVARKKVPSLTHDRDFGGPE